MADKEMSEEAVELTVSLQKMITDLNSGAHDQKALATFLKGYASKTCGLCSGIGHHSGECPIIKKMNRAVSANPVLKKVWGTYKAGHRASGR